MTWTLTAFGKTRLPLVGVPWRDLTDAEYRAAKARHPGMEDQGYFVQAEKADEKPKRTGKEEAPVVEESPASPEEEKPDGG